jgi:patatin-like phospholipase/acyl hydrolase
MAESLNNKKFKILALDGGGFRGAYTAHILKRMEEEYSIQWPQTFDLIAGTSTGSIIAAGLASGLSAEDIFSFYKEHGTAIFKKQPLRLIGFLASKYSNDRIRKALFHVFGTKRLGDIKTPLIIPATNVGKGCVHVFKSSYHPEFVRDKNVFVADIF